MKPTSFNPNLRETRNVSVRRGWFACVVDLQPTFNVCRAAASRKGVGKKKHHACMQQVEPSLVHLADQAVRDFAGWKGVEPANGNARLLLDLQRSWKRSSSAHSIVVDGPVCECA